MQEKDISIENLLLLYLEGSVTPEQADRVEKWLEEDAAHREILEQEMALYRDTDALFTMDSVDVEQGLAVVHRQMRRDRLKIWIQRVERIAAVLFLPLFLFALWQMHHNGHSEAVQMLTIRTAPGMTATTTLPDGTRVVLNSNSVLSYPAQFNGDERRLALTGEAYFSVKKDAEHPFIVTTTSEDAAVKVYGTKFNVETYPEQNTFTATLEEGSIALLYKDDRQCERERKIVPGEKIVYDQTRRAVQVAPADVDVMTAWTTDKLIFRNTSIKDVLNTLSKRYEVQFAVKNKQVYRNSFTGTLEKQRLERVLEILELSSNIQFRYKKDADVNQVKQTIEVY